jgi:RimJ/RimL family protein N-acetyltransferase
LILPFHKYGFIFRTVEEDDAEFILELRTNEKLAKHLSPTAASVETQKEWIISYKKREDSGMEAYFIATNNTGERFGVNRLYNFDESSYEIGSWLYKQGLDLSVPILGDLSVRDYAFEFLGYDACRFEVRKANLAVVKYHLAFRPEKVFEDELNYYFRLDYEAYKKHRDKLLKILNYGHR